MTSEVDIAIVGGGAAGVAAARALSGGGASVLLLEARARLGGRAWTKTIEDMPVDLGCGWLHSAERNGWTRIAEDAGVPIDRTLPAWREQWRDLGFPPAEREEAAAAYAAFDERLRADPPASDRASDALEPGGRWNGHIDAISSFLNGASLTEVSVRDYLAYDLSASDCNWRLPQGYGSLITGAMPHDVDVRLGTAVNGMDCADSRVRIETDAGTVRARQVILTIPTAVLTAGTLRLPGAAADMLHAASELPLGLADKVFLAVDGPIEDLDPDAHLLGRPGRADTGSYTLRPFGRPLIEAFLGGQAARAAEAGGDGVAAAFAIDELSGLLGTAWRRRLRPVAATRWGADPWSLGSYSHACPGQRDARARFAAGFDERIIMAGEAASPTDFTTAHGALETGLAAAKRAQAALEVVHA